jgi:hypothetical protein
VSLAAGGALTAAAALRPGFPGRAQGLHQGRPARQDGPHGAPGVPVLRRRCERGHQGAPGPRGSDRSYLYGRSTAGSLCGASLYGPTKDLPARAWRSVSASK